MKRLLPVLFVFCLLGCDDGDLTVETLDFEDATAQRCGNLIYKLNGNEAMIIEIPFEAAFINNPTVGGPLIFTISAENRVVYRSYNGAVSQNNICDAIQPATPVVVEEWNAASGTIEISTTAVTTSNIDLPGGEIITGYRHNIVFRNITFIKPSGTQLYQTFVFGDYTTNVDSLPFLFDGTLEKCATSNLLFDFAGNDALTLNIDADLLVNAVTPIGAPRTGMITNTTNAFKYIAFESGALTPEYFCTDPTPVTPLILEIWNGADGITGVSGIVEVTTTTNGTGFLHEVRLKNVTLRKDNSEFLLAADFLFGQYITQ